MKFGKLFFFLLEIGEIYIANQKYPSGARITVSRADATASGSDFISTFTSVALLGLINEWM
jgi:hypothetical protein